MNPPDIVSREQWLEARKQHLQKEKEFTRLRDELSASRRALPWVRVEKEYLFDTPAGKETLLQLFGDNSQLLVYHFMFDPDWDEGCPSCSFWADNYNGLSVHLARRDVSLVAIGRAPLEKLQAYRRRMGWDTKFVSSFNNDFNYDYHVSFTPEEIQSGEVEYNFKKGKAFSAEAPGISVFFRNDDGEVFHTYSCYSRGLDIFNTAYNLLDAVPKGRDEQDFDFPMQWVRRHDRYED